MKNKADLKLPLILMGVFWFIAVLLWRTTGNSFYIFNFGYIGTALGLGIGVYEFLPRRQKPWGRRLAQFLVGAYMLGFLGLLQRENMQLEGFFFYVLSGIFAGSVIHYLVAKLAGPLLFNRGWCGWACWTAMVLDLLPFRRSPGRLPGRWGGIRYLHFCLSLTLVLICWFGFNFRIDQESQTELWWLAVGNLLYYAVAVGLAFLLHDNRAFCKYFCPIPTLQKIPARASLLKVSGSAEKCIDCGACTRLCPMDIRVNEYARAGQRVTSSECILCMECIEGCPQGALSSDFRLDFGPEKLREKI
jgi:ferredoxin-type protein NapH